MRGSCGAENVVVLERGVVVDAEDEVDGFGFGGVAVDDGVLVESGAGFD
jgi:hypothetical protein